MGSAIAGPTFENVLYEKKGRGAYVTVNRPKVLNALNRKTLAELTRVFEDAGKDPAVLGVILTGSGSKAFISQGRTSTKSPLSRALKGSSLPETGRQFSLSSRIWGSR